MLTEMTGMFPELPYYLKIFKIVNQKEDSVKIEIHSRVHVEKTHMMPHTWSIEYVQDIPKTFRAEILDYCIKTYRLTKQPIKYM